MRIESFDAFFVKCSLKVRQGPKFWFLINSNSNRWWSFLFTNQNVTIRISIRFWNFLHAIRLTNLLCTLERVCFTRELWQTMVSFSRRGHSIDNSINHYWKRHLLLFNWWARHKCDTLNSNTDTHSALMLNHVDVFHFSSVLQRAMDFLNVLRCKLSMYMWALWFCHRCAAYIVDSEWRICINGKTPNVAFLSANDALDFCHCTRFTRHYVTQHFLYC